jgi:hypothetical protein
MPRKTACIKLIVIATTLTTACGSPTAKTSSMTTSATSSIASQIRQALNTIIPKESDVKAITNASGTVTVATELPEERIPTRDLLRRHSPIGITA